MRSVVRSEVKTLCAVFEIWNVQTSFKNANYQWHTDKFSTKLFSKLFIEWMASHSLNLTFAKTTKTIFSLWLICITWTDFVHFYGPICKLFLPTHCANTRYNQSADETFGDFLKRIHPLTTAGRISVRIMLQQESNKLLVECSMQ